MYDEKEEQRDHSERDRRSSMPLDVMNAARAARSPAFFFPCSPPPLVIIIGLCNSCLIRMVCLTAGMKHGNRFLIKNCCIARGFVATSRFCHSHFVGRQALIGRCPMFDLGWGHAWPPLGFFLLLHSVVFQGRWPHP